MAIFLNQLGIVAKRARLQNQIQLFVVRWADWVSAGDEFKPEADLRPLN